MKGFLYQIYIALVARLKNRLPPITRTRIIQNNPMIVRGVSRPPRLEYNPFLKKDSSQAERLHDPQQQTGSLQHHLGGYWKKMFAKGYFRSVFYRHFLHFRSLPASQRSSFFQGRRIFFIALKLKRVQAPGVWEIVLGIFSFKLGDE